MTLKGFQLDDDGGRHSIHPGLTVVIGRDPACLPMLAHELARAAAARSRHPSASSPAEPSMCGIGPVASLSPADGGGARASALVEGARWRDEVSRLDGQLLELRDQLDRIDTQRVRLDRLRQAAHRSALAASDALGLESLHTEIEAAREQADVRARPVNQARVGRLRQQERALLTRLGFSSWVEYRIAARSAAVLDERILDQIRKAEADLETALARRDEVDAIERALAHAHEQVAVSEATLRLSRPSTQSYDCFERSVLQHASGLVRHAFPLILVDPMQGWTSDAIDRANDLLRDLAGTIQVVCLTSDALVAERARETLDPEHSSVIELSPEWSGIDDEEIADLLVVHMGPSTSRETATSTSRDARPGWNVVVLPEARDAALDKHDHSGRCQRCLRLDALGTCTHCGRRACQTCTLSRFPTRGRLCVDCALIVAGVRQRRRVRR